MGGPVTRSRLLAGSVLFATFIAGVTVGGATMRLVAKDEVPQNARSREPRPDDERSRRHSVFDDLELTSAQRARIDSIFEERRRQTAEFWEAHGPQMSAIVDSTRVEIDRVLTPAQREQIEKWREERRRGHEERERREKQDSARSAPPTSMTEWERVERWHPTPHGSSIRNSKSTRPAG